MSNRPLQGMTILDLSQRLPGPFCGKILSDLGAEIIKIEDHVFQDPFSSSLFANNDDSFMNWYNVLNSTKKILRFDFNSLSDQHKILNLVDKADAIIMGIPLKLRKKLKLTDSDLQFTRPFVVLELLASKTENKSMHDLNALAHSGLLSLYIGNNSNKIIAPPFLPIAGIAFGQQAATDLLAHFISAQVKKKTVFSKTYLDQVTKELLGIFWHQNDRQKERSTFLHNGQYPCYSIYQTKDNRYVALAAVEEKFWNKFCEVFKLKTHWDRFYNQDDQLFLAVSNCISSFTLNEIEQLISHEDFCLTAIV
jgi:crotonobetainyl-CoA:carnitine CoA-transferase CaiB-like acyl-CoA transferase